MEKINEKLIVIEDALKTLEISISLFKEYDKKYQQNPSMENDQLMSAMRDSMIQRFEYCTDLLWKLLKLYLEEVEKISLTSTSPRAIIREAVTNRFISEQEGAEAMVMIKRRNETSHIYHEEFAETIAQEVPAFYQLMSKIVHKVRTDLH